MKKWMPLAVMATLAGCGDETSREDEVLNKLRAFQNEAEESARKACDAPADVEELEAGDSEAAACYFDLTVGKFNECAEEVFARHPDETEKLLACWQRDFDDMLACCSKDGRCSYSRIEDCRETLWDGEYEGACDVDTSAIEKEFDACP